MSVYPFVLTQDRFIHHEQLTFPFEERGLQFGDGIYEVIRIYQGKYYLLESHVDRLFRSATAIQLTIPYTKKQLTKLLIDLLVKNTMSKDGKVYLQITRGSAPRDHTFPVNTAPNMYAYVQNQPRNITLLKKGVSVILEPDSRWDNCHIKSLNLLPNVLAKQAAKEHGCYEAILHRDGIVTECSAANVYLVKNQCIYTFPPTNQILNGCVRMRVEQFAHDLKIPFMEKAFTVDDISSADELFLTSSTSEVMPIIAVDDKIIADGKPGAVTRKLQLAYENDANITVT